MSSQMNRLTLYPNPLGKLTFFNHSASARKVDNFDESDKKSFEEKLRLTLHFENSHGKTDFYNWAFGSKLLQM
jgi:hypothetical protein